MNVGLWKTRTSRSRFYYRSKDRYFTLESILWSVGEKHSSFYSYRFSIVFNRNQLKSFGKGK